MTEQGKTEPKRVISAKKKMQIIIGSIMLIIGSIIFVIGFLWTQGGTIILLLDQGGTISILGSFPMALGLGMISYNWYNETNPKSRDDSKQQDKSMD